MKYQPIRCPECGELAIGTVELIPARAEFTVTDEATGEAEWTGDTELFYDGQITEPADDPDHSLLECSKAHQWLAAHGAA